MGRLRSDFHHTGWLGKGWVDGWGGYLRRPHCSPCIRPQHIDQTRTPVGDNSILGNESKVGILRYKAATALTPGSVGYLG